MTNRKSSSQQEPPPSRLWRTTASRSPAAAIDDAGESEAPITGSALDQAETAALEHPARAR